MPKYKYLWVSVGFVTSAMYDYLEDNNSDSKVMWYTWHNEPCIVIASNSGSYPETGDFDITFVPFGAGSSNSLYKSTDWARSVRNEGVF